MKWEKLGCIFSPDKHYEWMVSHAACPFPEHLEGDIFRVYFSTRDQQNRSSIAYVDMDVTKPGIVAIADKPLLSPGGQGLFDDSGLSMMQIVEHQQKRFLYYMGWNLGVTVPFRNTMGLAIAEAGQPFKKYSNAPIIDRSNDDPFSFSSAWVRIENGAWRLWYGSHLSWEDAEFDMRYTIKYAESKDGIHWDRKNIICLPLAEGESGTVRPCIIHENGLYRMWYSIRIGRKETARMGYAESLDGIVWERRDNEAGLEASASGWDSEMVIYPCVFDHKGQRYMLYNGNRYGLTGFGLAVLT